MVGRKVYQWAAVVGVGLVLMGCQSIREATGVAKLPPDEFTVLTKAPLIIPPDFNLRPPQPGIASRNEIAAGDAGRAALFPQNGAGQAAAAANISEGERLLLTRTNALSVSPDIRRAISADNGQEDQGPEFAQRVLYTGTGAPPPAPTAAAVPPAATAAALPPAAAVAPAPAP